MCGNGSNERYGGCVMEAVAVVVFLVVVAGV